MNTRTSLGLAITLAAATSAIGALAALGKVSGSSLKFEAEGPAGLKINGEAGGVRLEEGDGKVKITAPTTAFKTGIGLRDRHLREYLECDRYPEATLVVDRAKISLPTAAGGITGAVDGSLTLHGVTRPARVTYRIATEGSGYHVDGDLEVNILDYQIKKPCYLGVCTGDRVKIAAGFTVQGS